MAKPAPKLTQMHAVPAATYWSAEFPNGAAYRVTTYPDHDFVFVQTWVAMRQCRDAQVVEAIEQAVAAQRAA